MKLPEPVGRAAELMGITLDAAVPLWIAQFRGLPEDRRRTIAAECAQVVAEKGDVLQFGGEGCAEAFNALAKGLALLSFSPGGVRFLGRHWRHKPTLRARRKA